VDVNGNSRPNRRCGVTEVSESTKCVRSITLHREDLYVGRVAEKRQDGNKRRREKRKLYCNTIREGASDGLTSERSEGRDG
jgi:hypothetical protein